MLNALRRQKARTFQRQREEKSSPVDLPAERTDCAWCHNRPMLPGIAAKPSKLASTDACSHSYSTDESLSDPIRIARLISSANISCPMLTLAGAPFCNVCSGEICRSPGSTVKSEKRKPLEQKTGQVTSQEILHRDLLEPRVFEKLPGQTISRDESITYDDTFRLKGAHETMNR